MRIVYDVLDPTGNITILVLTPIEEQKQPAVATKLMELEPEAEQVGFVSHAQDCELALRMAGGEFCGNASMSTAVLAAMEAGKSRHNVCLKVSGTTDIVRAEVEQTAGDIRGKAEQADREVQTEAEQATDTDASGERSAVGKTWTGTVDMPRPNAIEVIDLPGAGPLPVVHFEGISHIILQQMMPKAQAEALAPAWCQILGADAVGLLFLDEEVKTMTPLVYVPAAGTLFWERSCASGTTAVCAWMTKKTKKPCSIRLQQPGGTLGARSGPDGRIRLTGTVRLCKKANTDICL